ncbi:DEHA2D00616p [Debaryomyces hansenii CBS767]|uniref:DEHA2D00616p n=1 Tax=Debaryomyces hansenii (strain ATCC 36239 / CBS 767 / BCRC 21394 / JCM 1990 / NBRC 0083 / IGC 2968) TaxID=284592 RepID=Q6BTH4_DEBHA|nr:DEHA2D00616p [Debaryomyces hansenii CBS767]CAG86608.2 DEHA2D00616p [Debaryomyces hansenii CBS767]|eukprot:XP_458495.2 DEHA2D00616p [Debaryomyces hansenii CBS767]
MSDLDHFSYSSIEGVAKLIKSALIIHGGNCMLITLQSKDILIPLLSIERNLYGIINLTFYAGGIAAWFQKF